MRTREDTVDISAGNFLKLTECTAISRDCMKQQKKHKVAHFSLIPTWVTYTSKGTNLQSIRQESNSAQDITVVSVINMNTPISINDS